MILQADLDEGVSPLRRRVISGLVHRSKANPIRSLRPLASADAGRSRPSALAVFRLTASSYLVGVCTGRSAGFSGAYHRNHGPCRSGPNVSVLFVQSPDEFAVLAGGLGLSQIERQMPALLGFTFL